MNHVQVYVDEALELLKKIEAEADTYRNHGKTAEKLAQTLSSDWQGDSGNAVQDLLTQWAEDQHLAANRIAINVNELRTKLNCLSSTDSHLAGWISGSGSGRRG